MKKNEKIIVLTTMCALFIGAGAIVIYPYVKLIIGIHLDVKQIERKTSALLYATDHKALLDACREVIANRTKYNRNPYIFGKGNPDEYYPDPRDPQLPLIIRQLEAGCIMATDSHIIIELGGGFHHYGVNAFLEGIEGYGDKKLVESLWYYDDGYDECPNDWEKKLERLKPK